MERPEDPAIQEMEEKLKQQGDDESAPLRSIKPSKNTYDKYLENIRSGGPVNWLRAALDSDLPQASISPFRGISPSEARDRPIEHKLGRQQMNDIGTSSAQNTLKRKADSSSSANKKRKTDTDISDSNPLHTPHYIDLEESDEDITSNSNPLPTPHHITEIIDLEESDDDTVPNKLGILARDIGQKVRKRAKALVRTKPKQTAGKVLGNPSVVTDRNSRTALPQVQPTEPAKMVNSTLKTESKKPKHPVGHVLRNPYVVITRKPVLHMHHADPLTSGEKELGNNTALGRKCANNAPLPRTKKQKKLAKSKARQQAQNTNNGVSKRSTPVRKWTRKPPVDLKRDSPRVMRSWTRVGDRPTRHFVLDDRNGMFPLMTRGEQLEFERRTKLRRAMEKMRDELDILI